jgi:hypothetical protein
MKDYNMFNSRPDLSEEIYPNMIEDDYQDFNKAKERQVFRSSNYIETYGEENDSLSEDQSFCKNDDHIVEKYYSFSTSYTGQSLDNIEPGVQDMKISTFEAVANESNDHFMSLDPPYKAESSSRYYEDVKQCDLVPSDPKALCRLEVQTSSLDKRHKIKKNDNQLRNFHHDTKPYPKIEDLKLCLMRLMRRMIKLFFKDNKQLLSLELNESNKQQVKSFNIMKEIYRINPTQFDIISDTKSGPQSEGKVGKKQSTNFTSTQQTKKKRSSSKSVVRATSSAEIQKTDSATSTTSLRNHKTYNFNCMKTLLEDECIRGFYKAFIDFVFERSIEELRNILNIKCCFEQECDCTSKWENLKEFCMTTLVNCKLRVDLDY